MVERSGVAEGGEALKIFGEEAVGPQLRGDGHAAPRPDLAPDAPRDRQPCAVGRGVQIELYCQNYDAIIAYAPSIGRC